VYSVPRLSYDAIGASDLCLGHTMNENEIARMQETERCSAKAALEDMLLSALNSPAREVSDRDWEEMDRQFEERNAERRAR
jgi:hypothetical protein